MDRPRLNDALALVLLALVVLAPLPRGSNGAVFWLGSSAVVFACAAAFFAGGRLRLPARRFGLLGLVGGAYLAFALVQVFAKTSVAPAASGLGVVRILAYAVFFYLLVQVADERRRPWILMAVFSSIGAYALLGFVMRFGAEGLGSVFGPDAYPGSASGPFVNRNSFATYLGFGIVLGLALVVERWQKLRAGLGWASDGRLAFYVSVLAIMVATLVATNSRMGGLATLAAALYFALGRRWLAGVLVLGISGLAAVLFGETLWERLGTVEQDADMRLALYGQIIEMIKVRPLLGHGLDSFGLAFQGFQGPGVSPDLIWDKGHNSYLTNWAESGLVFGSIPALVGLWIFGYLRAHGRGMGQMASAVIVLAALHSLVDFSLEIQANMFVFLALLAVGFSESLSKATRSEALGIESKVA